VDHVALRYGSAAGARPKRAKEKIELPPTVVPDWARRPAPPEARPPRPLAPSAIAVDDESAPLPSEAMRKAALRGTWIHQLLERLPAVEAGARPDAADRWLERSAERFNRIDPARREPQDLVNRKFPSYNFDVIQGGITYEIDVTRAEHDRIRDLRYRGKPIDAAQTFIVVTNNYRASGGGRFPGLDGSNIVLSAPDANRDVLIGWVRERKHLTRAADGSERNWRFAPVETRGPVVFASASGKLDVAKSAGLGDVRLVKDNGDGFSTYAVDLAAKQHKPSQPVR
jgi:hypothetical protein